MGRQLVRKSKKKIIIVLLVIVLVLTFAAAGVYTCFSAVSIQYEGNEHYTEQELNEYIFGKQQPNLLLYALFGKKDKDIPFVQKYDVELKWPDKMTVMVYEKAIVGYISYMGCNMYFDKDGIVVESSSETYEGVPEIDGLQFKSIVLDSKLEVGNDALFSQILEMTQAFHKYELNVEKVYFDSSYNVTLYMGNVRVMLGSAENCMDKMYALKQISSQLSEMKGTLYMENYDGTSSSMIFKKEN